VLNLISPFNSVFRFEILRFVYGMLRAKSFP
jgi:hypothetical protein